MTSGTDTEIEQMSKFLRYPQSDFTFFLQTLGRHPTFKTLLLGFWRIHPEGRRSFRDQEHTYLHRWCI